MNAFYEDLEWRGLVQDVSHPDELRDALDHGSIAVYAGYDPTADSLHVGNLLIVMLLKRFQLAGHRAIALAGGGTGLIGDPSGKSGERALNSQDTVAHFNAKITEQLIRLLRAEGEDPTAIHANNADWIGRLSAVELLRDLGKHFSVNTMLGKDSVRTRIGNDTNGMSFTEFSYSILQAYDFQHLYDTYKCRLQVGGSDQWGNITAGLDLLRRTGRHGAHGMTTPLIVRSDGKKFGKTENGALWLSRTRTSPFALYQYFVNVPDADAKVMLRRLTLLPRDEILRLEAAVDRAPQRRDAQRALGRAVVQFVHGHDAVTEAERVTEHLFAGSLHELAQATLDDVLVGAPGTEVAADDLTSWESLLVATGLEATLSSARRTLAQGGVYVNEQRVDAASGVGETIGSATVAVLRRGPRNRAIVRLPA